MSIRNLKGSLDALPTPVLIFGNPNQDGDSLTSSIAVYDYLRSNGKECFIADENPVQEGLVWMIADRLFLSSDKFLSASSYVVLDQTPSRCPSVVQKAIASGAPTVVVDHHFSSEEEIKKIQSATCTCYWNMRCATAALLVEGGLLHPILFYGVHSDTLGFAVNTVEAVKVVEELIRTFPFDLTDDKIEKNLVLMNPKLPVMDFSTVYHSKVNLVSGDVNGKPFTMAFFLLEEKVEYPTFFAILTFLQKFANVVCLVDKPNKRVSLRSSDYEYDVSAFAKPRGGGGHIRAAGFSIEKKDAPYSLYYSLLTYFKVDNVLLKELDLW